MAHAPAVLAASVTLGVLLGATLAVLSVVRQQRAQGDLA